MRIFIFILYCMSFVKKLLGKNEDVFDRVHYKIAHSNIGIFVDENLQWYSLYIRITGTPFHGFSPWNKVLENIFTLVLTTVLVLEGLDSITMWETKSHLQYSYSFYIWLISVTDVHDLRHFWRHEVHFKFYFIFHNLLAFIGG